MNASLENVETNLAPQGQRPAATLSRFSWGAVGSSRAWSRGREAAAPSALRHLG